MHIPAARCDERARRAATPLAVTLQELQRICDTLAHHHQPTPRMSWRRLSGVYTVRCRSWDRLSAGTLSPGYLMTPQA